MNATTAFPLPVGTLDAERGELLRRVIDGLDPDAVLGLPVQQSHGITRSWTAPLNGI